MENAEGISEGTFNPFRYRGYYWDAESGLYYLNSRYYSPELCRFISADSQINGDIVGTNLFAYCSNNPINCIDADGYALDFLLDVASTAYSLWQVAKNPRNLSNWAALAADVACLAVPFATGGGTIIRGAAKYGNDVVNGVRITKAVDFTDDATKTIRSLDRSNGYTKSSREAGQKIHKGYKAKPNFKEEFKEFREVKGIRPDYVDFDNNTIYELKPNNPQSIKAGIKQLHRYNNALGGGFNMVLELY